MRGDNPSYKNSNYENILNNSITNETKQEFLNLLGVKEGNISINYKQIFLLKETKYIKYYNKNFRKKKERLLNCQMKN